MPAGISLAVGKFHARSAFHKSQRGFISLRSVLKGTTLTSAFFVLSSSEMLAHIDSTSEQNDCAFDDIQHILIDRKEVQTDENYL